MYTYIHIYISIYIYVMYTCKLINIYTYPNRRRLFSRVDMVITSCTFRRNCVQYLPWTPWELYTHHASKMWIWCRHPRAFQRVLFVPINRIYYVHAKLNKFYDLGPYISPDNVYECVHVCKYIYLYKYRCMNFIWVYVYKGIYVWIRIYIYTCSMYIDMYLYRYV